MVIRAFFPYNISKKPKVCREHRSASVGLISIFISVLFRNITQFFDWCWKRTIHYKLLPPSVGCHCLVPHGFYVLVNDLLTGYYVRFSSNLLVPFFRRLNTSWLFVLHEIFHLCLPCHCWWMCLFVWGYQRGLHLIHIHPFCVPF